MKRFIILLSLIISLPALASPIDQEADSAYAADDFSGAVELYLQALAQDGSSSALYYNIGNCYYRLGQPGKAIVNYERALRLEPRNEDARFNLAFVNSKIVDRQGERGSFISNTFDSASQVMSSNVWAWISVGLFTLMLGAIALYIFTSDIPLRKLGFFGALVLLLLTACAITLSLRAKSIAESRDWAVITKTSTILSTSPRTPKDRNEEAMLLHEGTKVEIRDSLSTRVDSVETKWYDVQVDNAHRAWIKSTEVERI